MPVHTGLSWELEYYSYRVPHKYTFKYYVPRFTPIKHDQTVPQMFLIFNPFAWYFNIIYVNLSHIYILMYTYVPQDFVFFRCSTLPLYFSFLHTSLKNPMSLLYRTHLCHTCNVFAEQSSDVLCNCVMCTCHIWKRKVKLLLLFSAKKYTLHTCWKQLKKSGDKWMIYFWEEIHVYGL